MSQLTEAQTKRSFELSDDPEKSTRDYIETEDKEEEQEYQRAGHGALKLDHAGLPLIPQPTDSPSDVRWDFVYAAGRIADLLLLLQPLNWPRKLKYFIVFQAAVTAFFGTFSLATANPAFAQIALALHIPSKHNAEKASITQLS
jgi:hypothetical protein